MPARLGYPEPIVDHLEAVARFRAQRAGSARRWRDAAAATATRSVSR